MFDTYIKIVIDVNKKVCSAGMDRHFEGEKILLDQGSKQSDIWGGGVDLETKMVDFNSFINIRPNDNEAPRANARDIFSLASAERNLAEAENSHSSTVWQPWSSAKADNDSNEILDPGIREEYTKLTKFFFKECYEPKNNYRIFIYGFT